VGATSQLPRGAKCTWRAQERHKGWEREGSDKSTSQRSHQHSAEIRRSTKSDSVVGQQANFPKQCKRWIPEQIFGTEGSIQNWISPPCWGKSWPNRVVAEGQHRWRLVKTTALITLHQLVVLPHLIIPANLVDGWPNTIHKPVTW
jgi:hypothetical protein